jgi:hypothetical protein
MEALRSALRASQRVPRKSADARTAASPRDISYPPQPGGFEGLVLTERDQLVRPTCALARDLSGSVSVRPATHGSKPLPYSGHTCL